MWKSKIHIIVIFLSSFFLFSCHLKPAGVLSEEKMENILFEMHKTEGALQAKEITAQTLENKKLYFSQILKNQHVTQAEFDSTIVWYTKHPMEFADLYKNIITRFDTLNAQVQRGTFHPKDANYGITDVDIWNLKKMYKFTKDSMRTKVDFEIAGNDILLVGDKYTLSFLRRVAPCDSSENPFIVLKINYLNGKKDSIFTKTYNDSLLRRYKLIFKVRDTLKIKSISGSLLGVKTPKGKMCATLDSVKLMRSFNTYNQYKIRQRVDAKDKTAPTLNVQ